MTMEKLPKRRKKPSFLRRDWYKCIRFNRRKKLKWRRARGRHSKLRQKWKSHQKMPSIGYGQPKEIRGLVKGMKPIMINNSADLEKIGKEDIALLSGKVGGRKKAEIAKKALEKGIGFANFDAKRFLDASKKEEAEGRLKKAEEKK